MTEPSDAIAESNLRSAPGKQAVHVWRRPLLFFAILATVSLGVRLAALAHWGTGAIDSEGAEYARIAQNLRAGIGYVGMTSPGKQLLFPPLFPLLIGAASFVTPDYEWAGRIVSLIFGSLLPLPMFGIASQMFSRRAGYVAALLAMCYPILVNLSFAVLSEAPYITLLLSAVYLVLRSLDRPSIGRFCLAGGMFGLAYLTRQEAVAPLLIAVFVAICSMGGTWASRSKPAAAALAVFAIVALPEVAYLYSATGQIRLEGKSPLIYDEEIRTAIGEKNNEANPDQWALHSINANLERTGTANRPQADVVRETRMSFGQLARIEKKGVRHNFPVLLEQLSSRWMAAPFLTGLAILGALRRPWKRRLLSTYLYVLLVPCALIMATFSLTWFIPRFYFVLVPFLLIWAANGLVGVGLWMEATLDASGWHGINPVIPQWIAPALVGLILVLYPIKGVREIYEFHQGSRATQGVKQLGLWLGQQQNHQVTIMDSAVPLAFHAKAQWVAFPYCDGDLALRFLDAAKVDYVILHQDEKPTQYYQDWLKQGIPDRRAVRVNVPSALGGDEITIVRWQRAGSDFPGDSTPVR